MVQPIRLAVDAMGGDLGPQATVPAALQFAAEHSQSAQLDIFYSDEFKVSDFPPLANVRFIACDNSVAMTDSPASVLRHKLGSSMAQALKQLADGNADVCVSAGNTGGLVALSCKLVGTVDGLKRPAICKPIPTLAGHSYMLDLGANTQVNAEQINQFAYLGALLAREIDGVDEPKVTLLNIGAEASKGGEVTQAAHKLLQVNSGINYLGFIEGDAIYSGQSEVIVCDGFAGNVALKVSEGVAKMALSQLKLAFKGGFYGRLLGQIAKPLLRKWHTQFDPARYNGACLLGLNKVVVKSHGAADERSFRHALHSAVDFTRLNTVDICVPVLPER